MPTIIDGQQRITTVILIYIAIYALAQELDNESLKSRINETYLVNKFAQEEEYFKLKSTENNDKALILRIMNIFRHELIKIILKLSEEVWKN